MKGQAITIASVVACGIASYVTLRSAYGSLQAACDAYYASQRFADVFVHLKRAPDTLLSRIESIPGVAVAESRLVEPVMLPMDDLAQPASGQLIGVGLEREAGLDAPFVTRGRMPQPGQEGEVALLAAFAEAHGLEPGAKLPVVINGTRRDLVVVGIVMSPEYVFALPAGGVTVDAKRFAVLWMDRASVGPAFQLDGAFDDVVLRLQPGASERAVADQLDTLLEPYGGLGAVSRDRQPSNFAVSNQLGRLRSYAFIGPVTFLSVAAFLVNVVLARLVHLQRPQIATLKALGYTNREIGLHFLELALIVVVGGAAVGVGLGAWLGHGMLGLFQRYFQFPSFPYLLDARVLGTSVAVSVAAGSVGALTTVRRVSRLAPAEAMQPETPPTYRETLLERLGPGRLLSAAARMVLREVTRRPVRLALSVLGIALGVAVIVSGAFIRGSVDAVVSVEFETAQRDDLSISFTQATDGSALRELSHLPGVLQVEGLRTVPVRIRNGYRFRDLVVTGHPDGQLRRVAEWPPRLIPVPEDGVLLTEVLGQRLGLRVGDFVQVEVREGNRPIKSVRVAGLSREMFGMNAHMSLPALYALLDETDTISLALLKIDDRQEDAIDAELKKMRRVASVARRRDVIAEFNRQSAQSQRTTSVILTIFGAMLAVGVVYNNARIALSMRSRDLASLRVLGFTRREISAVLLGELATYVALAIVPGLVLGRLLATAMMSASDPELYRIPAVITTGTYVFSAGVTVLAGLVSALLVRQQLDRLDLIAVLKARE
jgi:putative ABC transport system permease protein